MENREKFSKFVLVWFGQFMSILGSGLSSFGLSVWILSNTGAATPFALSVLCSVLPTIIFAPFAGSFADRKNRKRIIMISDGLDACLKVVMALFLFGNVLRVWMVYPIMFLSATFSTFQSPAFSSTIPQIVKKEKLSKANGMIQLSQAAQSMIAPALAGGLYGILQLKGLLVIDVVTFTFALVTIWVTTIPEKPVVAGGAENKKSLWATAFGDFGESWKYLKSMDNMLSIILVFAVLNFIANMCMVLIGPMLMINYDSAIYGVVETVYGVAMVVGGILASSLPDVKNKIKTMFATLILSGVGLIITGIRPEWYVVAAGMFVFFLLVPYANTLFSTVLQSMIEASMMGRSMALVGALLKIVTPIACVIAGPLSDYVFEPMMMQEGVLGKTVVGNIIGYGSGRGSGLLFVFAGIILSIICICGMVKARSKADN